MCSAMRVNLASRLQGLAEPDSICISDVVYRDVATKLELGAVVSLGQPKLKNIDQRFPVYMLVPEHAEGVRRTLQAQRLKLLRPLRPVHWLSAAGLLLIVGVLITTRYFPVLFPNPQPLTPNPQALPLPDKPSIVVLPFDNMSKDPEQEYFSNGTTEVLTADLSRISSSFVIARNPNSPLIHFQLAGIYSELGREEEAQAAAAEVLRLNPNFSLEVWRQRIHFKDPTIVERWLAAARKAGLKWRWARHVAVSS